MFPSTKSQRQLIGIACGQLGIDKQVKADMLRERYGKESTCDITRFQADEFLRELRGKGFRVVPKKSGGGVKRPRRQAIPREAGKVTAIVSQKELEKMAAVAALIPWRLENGLALWMKKRIGVEKIRTAMDAYKVIEGLKKMFENGMKKQHGPEWWLKMFPENPGIETYIREHCPSEYRWLMATVRYNNDMITGEEFMALTGQQRGVIING
ncbi:MAG: DUF1018 domain-containing protein [Desulfobacterales bacterium]|nr:DUF1018 domain-containing protein [Desulfobacterales bacterium]